MKVLSFNHMSFTVANLDASIAFFVDGLGFELLSRAPRDPRLIERMIGIEGAAPEIAFVAAAGQRVELIAYHAPADRTAVLPRLCDVGAAHVGLDVDDIDAAVDAAARHGYGLAGEVITIDAGPNRGSRVGYVRDAHGMTVEFLQAAAPKR